MGFEFEERLNTKREEDKARVRQIAWLRATVLRLTVEHNRTTAAIAMITQPGDVNLAHGGDDDLG